MNASIAGKNEQVVIRSAQTLPMRVLQAMGRGLARALPDVVQTAQRGFLSGPRPYFIQSISGRLRSGVWSRVEVLEDRVVGRVGNAVKYAAYHEFGYHGREHVRAHQRVRRAWSTQTWEDVELRRGVYSDTGVQLGWKESRIRVLRRMQASAKRTGKEMRVGAQVVNVRAYAREINYPGKPYIRPALEPRMPMVIAAVDKELDALGEEVK